MLGTLPRFSLLSAFQVQNLLKVFSFSILLLASFYAQSQTTSWTGGAGDFNFQNPANWTFNVPVNGSNVVIPTTVASDITNVPALTLNDLTIQGSCLFASSVTGSNLVVNGNFTVTAGSTFTIGNTGARFNFILANTAVGVIDGTVVINSDATFPFFQVDGNLTISPTGLVKDDGTNPGDFTLSPGATLRIGSINGITISPNLSGAVQVIGARIFSTAANYAYVGAAAQDVGDGFPTTVNSLSINNAGGAVSLSTPSSALTITNSLTINNGTLDLQNNDIASVSSVNLTGGNIVSSGSGILNVAGNIVTNGSTLTSTIAAPVDLGSSDRTITVANGGLPSDLTISGVVSGGAGVGFTKAGLGVLTLSGNNTFSGVAQINSGTVKLGASGAAGFGPLGDVSQGTSVASGASLDLNGFSLSNAEGLTINGTGISSGGAISNTSASSASFIGDINLASSSSIAANNGNIDLSGAIAGGFNLTLSGTSTGRVLGSIMSGSVTKNGSGTWSLNAANSYNGGTSLDAGTLNINDASALGSASSTFTVNGGSFDNTSGGSISLLDYPVAWNGDFTFVASNQLIFGSGAVTMNSNRNINVVGFNNLILNGSLNAPSFNIIKNGAGPLAFNASPVTLNSLIVNGGTFITTSNTLTLSGDLVIGPATFNSNGGTVSFVGNSPQVVAGVTYQNILLTGSGVKNAAASITVNNLTNTSTLNMGTNTLTASSVNNAGGVVRFSGFANGLAINSGTVEYNGASQNISPGAYSDLTINQSSGDALITGLTTVNGILNLTSGKLNLGVSQLTLGSSASVVGVSSSKFIIATGGGLLRKDYSATGSFTFPIGDNIGTNEYSPITVDFISGSGPSYIEVSVTDAKHPNNNSSSDFLTRYWTVSTGASGSANISASYPVTSVSGTEASISAGQLTGAFNQVSNPWIKFSPLAGGTLMANGAALNSSTPSFFTGVTGSSPIANAGVDKSICNLASVTLGGTPTASGGAGGYSYSWSPSINLSAANIANPVFTATSVATTPYTVTVTDANGFVSTSTVNVTVNALPTPSISGVNSVCVGQSGVTYSTASTGNIYNWVVTNGIITAGSGTNTITVTWSGPTPGTVQLTETIPVTLCAVTTAPFNVSINPTPTPVISGSAIVCANQNSVSYSTPPNAGRTYAWAVSGGAITAGAGTSSITVTWGSAGSGTVDLIETITASGCATTATTFAVTINSLPTPTISGLNSVCENQTGVIYSTGVSGNNFNWTITGGSITSGAGSNSVTVSWGSSSPGTLQLTETNPVTLCSVATTVYNVTINPLPTPSISGAATACSGQAGFIYSTAPNAGRSYAWSVSGGTITSGSGSNSITVTWGSAGSGTVDLIETVNSSGCFTVASTFNVIVNPLPAPSITGLNSVCANQNSVSYSTTNSGNTFFWTVTGGTIASGQGTNSILVNWGSAGVGAVQLVETISSTGCSVTTPSLAVTISPNPSPNISGSATVCSGQTGVSYSTAANANRTYAWIVSGGSITSGSGTNSIVVTWGSAGIGTVDLTETITTSGCSSIAPSFSVTINASPTPSITGINSVCAGQTGVTYSTSSAGNNYVWSVTGGTIVSGGGTNTITVDWGAAGAGSVQLIETVPVTLCATTTPLYAVTINASPSPVIAGSNAVCANQSGVTYSTPFNAGRNYVWTVNGGSVSSGAGTNSITITWGAAGVGTVQVIETIVASGCTTLSTPLSVNINSNPAPVIIGSSAVCANATGVVYSTALVGGDTYSWVVTGGTINGTSTNNSVTVDWGAGPSGTVQLLQTTSATGCSTLTPLYNVTVNPNPSPVISGLTQVCANNTGVSYATTFNPGSSYGWAITGGTITAGATSSTVTVTWGAAGAGTLQVTETLPTGCSTTSSAYNVTVNANPSPSVSGPSSVCVNASGLIYSTSFVAGNTYIWSLPGGGGSITSGGTTNQATVTWTASGSNTIQVTETVTSTGCSITTANYGVTVNPTPTPVISGANIVCAGQSGVAYSTPSGIGRTYLWTITGGTITSGANSNSILVDWGLSGSGSLQLQETITATTCSTTTALFGVTINPTPTPSIVGTTSVCAGQTGVTYSTTNVGGNSYSWSVTGGSITSGAGTNSIVVSWGVAGSGSVSLTETVSATGCATTTVPYNVTVNTNPTPFVSGSNNVCANQTGVVYSTSPVAGRGYSWTVTGGIIASGSTTNSIQVDWGVAGIGTVQLTETIVSSGCSVTTPVLNVVVNAPPTPSIGGLATVCENQSGVVYTTPASGNVFFWSVSGGSITAGAGTNSIVVSWGAAGLGTINMTEISLATGCSTSASSFNVTINALPNPIISGSNSVCANDVGKIYTVPFVSGNNYSWAVSGGTITGSSTNNSVTVDWGSAGTGTLQLAQTVTATGCSYTTPLYNVTINPLPTPIISGINTVCANQAGVIYSTSNVPGNSYAWSVSGGLITAGAGTNTITVTWNGAGTGNVSLIETTSATGCATTATPVTVTINPNPTPFISGNNTVCEFVTNKVYSTPLVAGNSYSWSITGGTITSASNGNSVTVNWGAAGTGSLSLVETIALTGCSTTTSPYTVTINANPAPIISGSNAVCANQSGVGYSTPNNVGNLYSWSVAGGTIVSGAGTNSIIVDWGVAGSGTVVVTETISSSGCSVTTSPLSVTINSSPTPIISGSNSVCANALGKVYTTPLVAGHTYSWAVSGGTINGSATNNSVTIDWGAAGSGTIVLTETITATGCSVITPVFNVTINPLPTPVISGLNMVCALQSGVSYSTTNVIGNTYTWVISGGTIVSGANTNSVVVNWGASGTGSVAVTESIPSSGCSTTTAGYSVTINPSPSPFISGNNTVCANDTKTYSTPFTGGNSYNWVVTGGTISGSSTSNTITIIWGGSGTGTLSVTESSGCSTTTPTYNVTINANPAPAITGLVNVCANQTGIVYSTTNVVGNSYSWNVVGGSIVSGGSTNSVTVNWGSAGSGSVSVTETISSTGCSITTSPYAVAIGPSAVANAGADAEVCAGTPFNLTSATASNYASITWSGGTGTFSPSAFALNPTYTPGVGETGNITLTLTATGIGLCPNVSDQMILTITPAPTANAGSDSEICQGFNFGFFTQSTGATATNYASLLWTKTGGTGSLVNASTLTPTYLPGVGETGIITFTLTATSSGSCAAATSTMQLTITPSVNVSAGANAAVCQGTALDFSTRSTAATASNYNTITWSGGTGSFSPNANALNPIYTPTPGETGVITFTLTATGNGSCATKTSSFTLNITPAVTVNAGSNTEVCQGLSFNLGTRATLATASNYNTLAWSGGLGSFTNGNTLNPTYNPAVGETGIITLTLTATGNGSCATQTSTMQLTITPSVNVNAGIDAAVCQGTALDFSTRSTAATASNYNTITWSGGAGSFSPNANALNPIYTPTPGETGVITFTLTATGNGSCATKTSSFTLNITPAVTVNAGSNAEVCQGLSFNLGTRATLATASNYNTLAWSGGLGSFTNGNTLNPTYNPAVGETGIITLTLAATGNGSCATQTSTMQLTITPSVNVNAGANAAVCQGTALDFSLRSTAATASNYNTITWSGGAGSFSPNANALNPIYTPTPGETGVITFTLTATGNGSCATKTSTWQLTISPSVSVNAGSNSEICSGNIFNFATQSPTSATAANFSSLNWTTTGTGTILNAGTLTPVYIPGPGETGVVNFTLRANGLGSCPFATSNTQLLIRPAATVSAGANAETCQGVAFNFGSRPVAGLATASNFASLAWTHTGTGSITSGAGSLSPVYAPGAGETGTVTFTLTATGNGVCPAVQSQMILTITPVVVVNAGSNEQICQGSTFNFSSQASLATASNVSSVVWSHNGSGTLFNANSLTPTYFASPSETGNVTFTLRGNSTGSCPFVTSTMILNIVPAPISVAGSNAEVCEGTPTFPFLGRTTIASASNGSPSWTHNGAGTLSSATTLNPIYTLAPADFGNTITFTLKVTSGAAVCAPVTSTFQLKVNRKAIVNVPANYTVCESPTFNVTGTIGGTATTGLWSVVSGSGSLSATNVSGLSVNSTYTINSGDVGGAVTFRLTSNDPDGPTSPCLAEFADVAVTINRAANISAGPDLATCQNDPPVTLGGVINYAPNGVVWSGGLGILGTPTSATSTYAYKNPNEVNANVVLTLTGNDPDGSGPCTSVSDQMNLKVNPLPLVTFSGLPPNIAQNAPVQTLVGTQAGGLFTISPLTSNIGTTVQTPNDKASFDPSAVTLGPNTVTYTYTDANGCTNTDAHSVIVNPITVATFSIILPNGNAAKFNTLTSTHEVCANQGKLDLVGSPPATQDGPNQFIGFGLTVLPTATPGGWQVDTNVAPGTYLINYQYTNALGATTNNFYSVKILAAPTAVISNLANNCISSPIVLNGNSSSVTGPANIVSWNWDYGNTFSTSGTGGSPNILAPPYTYNSPGNYTITLRVQTNEGCVATATLPIRVGAVPLVDFASSKICTNDFTIFQDQTGNVVGGTPAGISNILTFSWDFGDGFQLNNVPASGIVPPGTHGGQTKAGTANSRPEHNYSSPGTYTVTENVTTDDGCSNTISKTVFILPAGVTVTPNAATPYNADFESTNGNWVSEQLQVSKPGVFPVVFSQFDDWRWSALSGNTINQGVPGSVKAWWTGKNISTPTSSYNVGQGSAVNGPCFDLTQLKRPMISFDYWSDAQNNFDGTVLQYSIDGGINWAVIGPLPGQNSGINWYNSSVLQANPGNQIIGSYGWTDKQGGWKRAAFNLDAIPVANRSQVRVRFAFGSTSSSDPTKTFDGFAFDNVYVGEKTRNVLIEHFTNLTLVGSAGADTYLNTLFNNEEVLRGVGNSDFNNIQYHVSFSSNGTTDQFNFDNPKDPDTRSGAYAVTQPPRTFMDGLRNNSLLDGTTTKLNNIEIDRRALVPPKFTLQLIDNPTGIDSLINIQMSIKAEVPINTALIAQVALVEDNVVLNTVTYRNVLKKLLFGSDAKTPDGITITQPFAVGQILTTPKNNVLLNTKIYDGNNLKLIGFVQDKNTGEVYQSVIMKAPYKINSLITAVEEDPVMAALGQIQIFPNPANGKFNFTVPGQLPDGCIWKISDQRGVFVDKGDFNGLANGIKTVDVSQLADGMYFVLIGAEGKTPVYRKLVVMNQK